MWLHQPALRPRLSLGVVMFCCKRIPVWLVAFGNCRSFCSRKSVSAPFDTHCNQPRSCSWHLTAKKPKPLAMLLLALLYSPFEGFLQQWPVQQVFWGFITMLLLSGECCNHARLCPGHLTARKPKPSAMLLLASFYSLFEMFLQQWLVERLFQGSAISFIWQPMLDSGLRPQIKTGSGQPSA